MARPAWKGHISSGLVSIPVHLQTVEQRRDLRLLPIAADPKPGRPTTIRRSTSSPLMESPGKNIEITWRSAASVLRDRQAPRTPYAPSMSRYEQFHAYRARMNARILAEGSGSQSGAPRPGGTLVTRRFFALDTQSYKAGALPASTKELLGLVASMVLRCDDCIAYHVDQCVAAGATDEELWETFDVALVVGGSIVIPHLRRAVEFLDECRARPAPDATAP